MDAIIERCCGLDVHEAVVVACLLVGRADERPRKTVRSFGALTADLFELREWLLTEGCTHVAMESTGIYWRPVHALLEDAFDVTLGNAHHIKNVPGRKTDVKDAEWIADLLRHGLIRKSFVPPKAIRDLRDIVRYRRKVVHARAAERNRLLKMLETANVKLSAVLTNVFGASGRLMLTAVLEGKAPLDVAHLAKGRLRQKMGVIQRAVDGRLDEHHRFLLKMQLDRLDAADANVIELDARIDALMQPYRQEAERLDQIPGVDRIGAAAIIAEIGVDMSVFKSAAHLASWAGVCPGNHESAGKRKKGTKRKGNVHLTTTLVEAAQSAIKKKDSYFRDKSRRLVARRGKKRGLVAIAHKILIAAYHLLATGDAYRELGGQYLDRLDERRTTNALVRRLERLGYSVQIEKAA